MHLIGNACGYTSSTASGPPSPQGEGLKLPVILNAVKNLSTP